MNSIINRAPESAGQVFANPIQRQSGPGSGCIFHEACTLMIVTNKKKMLVIVGVQFRRCAGLLGGLVPS